MGSEARQICNEKDVSYFIRRAAIRFSVICLFSKCKSDLVISEISPGVRLEVKSSNAGVQLRVGFAPGLEAIDFFDPRNVGFGLTYSLPVLVAILSLPPGGIIVVENPEAHLHSRGQVKMGTLFALAAQSGIQVLVETHSDHFLNGVRLAVKNKILAPAKVCINFFRRVPGKEPKFEVESPAIDQNGRINRWPDDFFDQWDKSLDQLLD